VVVKFSIMFRIYHNSWPNRQRDEVPPPETAPNYFDFAVSTTVYRKGSGPPLSLPTPTAERKENQDGTIIEFIPGAADRVPRFIVGSIAKPGLRVTVRAIDILDWVSAKTYEEWNFQQTKEERRKTRLEGLHWKARQKLKQDREAASGSRDNVESETGFVNNEERIVGMMGQGDIVPKKRGRSFRVTKKKLPIVEQASSGRSRRRISSQVEALTSQSSLISPSKQPRGLADISIADSSDEVDVKDEIASSDIEMLDDNNQLALELQLNGDARLDSESRNRSRSRSDSLGIPDDHDRYTHHQDNMPSSREAAANSPSKKGVTQSILKSPSSAAKKLPQQKPISSFFIPGQKLSSKVKRSSPSKKTQSPPQPLPKFEIVDEGEEDKEGEDEEEWEVDRIVSHEIITNTDGSKTFFYLLKWKGEEYENTWEPRKNVSPELVKEYHAALMSKTPIEIDGKMKRLEDKKRKREEEVRKEKQRRKSTRSTRSISRAATAEAEEARANKPSSRSPAVVSYKYHDNENLYDPDDNDNDVEMPDIKPRGNSVSNSNGKSGTNNREDTKSREGTASSGLFVGEMVAPVANMFGPVMSKPNGDTKKPCDVNINGKKMVRSTIELDSSPEPAENMPRLDKGKVKVIEILISGEEKSVEEEEDELA